MVRICKFCNKKYNDKHLFIKHIIFCELNECRLIPYHQQKTHLLNKIKKIRIDYDLPVTERKDIINSINTEIELLWDSFAKRHNEMYLELLTIF